MSSFGNGVHAAVTDESARPPYAVGNTTIFIHDPSRGYDEAAGVNTGIRTMITEIWYPVAHAIVQAVGAPNGQSGPTRNQDDGADNAPSQGAVPPTLQRRATYGDYVFGNRAVHRLMMTRTTFFHLTPDTAAPGVGGAQIDAAIDELFSRARDSYTGAPLAGTGSAS